MKLPGAKGSDSELFTLDDFHKKHEEGDVSGYCTAEDVPYETVVSEDDPRKRLIEQVRVLYKPNAKAHSLDPPPDDDTNHHDLSCLELGAVDSLALPYETYKLAFTQSLLDQITYRTGSRQGCVEQRGTICFESSSLKEGEGIS
jgi:hypothetical protein